MTDNQTGLVWLANANCFGLLDWREAVELVAGLGDLDCSAAEGEECLRMLLGKELVTEAIVDNLLSWRHSGFSAHGTVRVENRPGAVRLG